MGRIASVSQFFNQHRWDWSSTRVSNDTSSHNVHLYDMTPPQCITRSQVLHYTIEELLPGAILVAFVVFLSSFAGAKKFAMKAGGKKMKKICTIERFGRHVQWCLSVSAVMQWTKKRCCVCLCRVVQFSDHFHPPGLPQGIYNTTVTPRFHVFLLSTSFDRRSINNSSDLWPSRESVRHSIGQHVRNVIPWVIYPAKVI